MGRNRTLEAIISIAGQLDPSLAQSINNAQKQFGGLKAWYSGSLNCDSGSNCRNC